MLASLKCWLQQYQALGWMIGGALVGSVLTLAVGTALVVLLPADYFVRDRQPNGFWGFHPVLRWTLLIGKNLLGWVVILVGLLLSLPLVPGPGILFILVGLGLVDLPGSDRSSGASSGGRGCSRRSIACARLSADRLF